MCIAVVGGIKRLKRHYVSEAEKLGVNVKVFNTAPTAFSGRLRDVDAMVIFTNQTSHTAKNAAVKVARQYGIPLRLAHSCGICSLRDCVKCLVGQIMGPDDASRLERFGHRQGSVN